MRNMKSDLLSSSPRRQALVRWVAIVKLRQAEQIQERDFDEQVAGDDELRQAWGERSTTSVESGENAPLVPQQSLDLIAVDTAGAKFNAAPKLQQILTVEGGID